MGPSSCMVVCAPSTEGRRMQIVIHSYNKLDHMFSHCFYTNNGFGLSHDSTTLIFDSDKRVRTVWWSCEIIWCMQDELIARLKSEDTCWDFWRAERSTCVVITRAEFILVLFFHRCSVKITLGVACDFCWLVWIFRQKSRGFLCCWPGVRAILE